MVPLTPSYEYHEDGSVSAIFEGRQIAKGSSFEDVSETATDYLDGLQKKRDGEANAEKERKATHIVTPNGLKGQIISRVDALWGNQITVRFENNEIRRFDTTAGLNFVHEAADEPSTYTEALQSVLDRDVDTSHRGLTARVQELEAVKREVHDHFASEYSSSRQRDLHRISMQADAELGEIKDALAHIAQVDAENAVPAAPVYAATEQASFGHKSGEDWLEVTAREMIAESESTDLEKLMKEGPTVLVSNLDDSAVHHAGTVQEIAAAHVLGKTAGFQGAEVESYREAFVAAVEQARRRELTYRKKEVHTATEQKVAAAADTPDEALFL